MRLQGRGSSAHKEGVANVCWPHVSWEIVYSRFVVHYHGDDDHGGGCNPDTRVSNRYAEVYKPSSLLRTHIADTSALPMLELGLMPVVTTMVSRHHFRILFLMFIS